MKSFIEERVVNQNPVPSALVGSLVRLILAYLIGRFGTVISDHASAITEVLTIIVAGLVMMAWSYLGKLRLLQTVPPDVKAVPIDTKLPETVGTVYGPGVVIKPPPTED